MSKGHTRSDNGRTNDPAPTAADDIKYTTCYMCACRCGIRVHLDNNRIRFIDGNPNHPVNGGVLCAKGSAGIMQQQAPSRLKKPLLRTGDRGSGEFREIEWDEALGIAAAWLRDIRDTDPSKLAFFTGRDQSQALTGWWANQFGTPNYAAHGGFCSVNMAAAGMYTFGGSFWEFGEPDYDRTRYFLMFGVAEDHDSNPIKIGLGKIKENGAKFVSVNPVRTGYSAIADEWLGIRPGTDGLLIFALIHELLRQGNVDVEYLVRYTNAPWLVIDAPGEACDGLFARNDDGEPLCWDGKRQKLVSGLAADVTPALKGEYTVPGGHSAVPVMLKFVERYLDDKYSPDAVAATTGIPADTIRRIAAELAQAAFEEEIVLEQPWTDWAGRRHDTVIGRPVSMHAMRGISAHSNGFHTCRALHLLQILLGSIDTPGGFLYKPPYPKTAPPAVKPTGKKSAANTPLGGAPLGYPTTPEDLLVTDDNTPTRIDKAYSWEAPLAAHGMMHMVIRNAWAHDPYPIDTLFMYMANMAWNSSMNTSETIAMLTDRDPSTDEYRIPHIIYSDAFYSETVAYADLVLPDTTYLERWDCISLQDRPICSAHAVSDSIRNPVLKPDRDVRPFQDVLIELGAMIGLPGLTAEDGSPKYPGGYADFIVNHEFSPGFGLLAGHRGKRGDREGRGPVNPRQLDAYVENQCFWTRELAPEQRYLRHANKSYLDYAVEMGFIDEPQPVVFQLYSEVLQRFRLAARGHGSVQPPESQRERVDRYFDPLPFWYAPLEDDTIDTNAYPLHAITQRPMAMYHSWGSQNAWLRQIHGANRLYVSHELAEGQGLCDDDWVWIVSRVGKVRAQVQIMHGVNAGTVWTWNAIGKRKGAWNLKGDTKETELGFLLNHLIGDTLPADGADTFITNSDPVTGQAAWYDLRVRVEKVLDRTTCRAAPQFHAIETPDSLDTPPEELRFGEEFSGPARRGES